MKNEILVDENNIYPITIVDHFAIKDGQSVFKGELFDVDGAKIGLTPMITINSKEEYQKYYLESHPNEPLNSDPPNPFEPIKWGVLNDQTFPEQKWWIKNLLPFQGIALMASPSGEKKTWLAMEMSKCVAIGEPFLGQADFFCSKGTVLYIDMEMSKAELQRRGRLLGFNKTNNNIWLLSMNDFNLNTDEGAEVVSKFIEEKNIDVVFIDTFRAVAGGMQEEKAELVRKFFNRLKPLKDKGKTLVFLDHCRKPAQFEGKIPKKEQLFASQDKVASAEMLIMLKTDEKNGEVGVYVKKNRTGIEYPPFGISMKDQKNDNDEIEAVILNYVGKLEEKEAAKIEQAKELITDALKNGPILRKEFIAIGKSNGVGEKNISDALRSLEADITIASIKVKREKQYFLPSNDVPIEQEGTLKDNLPIF